MSGIPLIFHQQLLSYNSFCVFKVNGHPFCFLSTCIGSEQRMIVLFLNTFARHIKTVNYNSIINSEICI